MTLPKIILDDVKSRAKDQFEKWEQVMNKCQVLACLTDVGDRTMASII